MITLWLEGYSISGNSAKATFLGAYDSESLEEAVRKWEAEDPIARTPYLNYQLLAFWGCRFFDNETDARKTFG